MTILAQPYHVTIRRLADHQVTFEWHEYNGRPMDYPAARKLLLGVGRHLPALHQPGAGWYLSAEPMQPIGIAPKEIAP